MNEQNITANDDNEKVFYLPDTIGKRTDLVGANSTFYVRTILSKIMEVYNIDYSNKIGVVADIDTIEYIMIDLIEGYSKYWGDNINGFEDDIDFSSLPDKV